MERSEPTFDISPGNPLRGVAADLARDGYAEESVRVAERAVAWYASHGSDPLSLAESLLLADRAREALDVLRTVLDGAPDNLQAHGLAGVASARLGDRDGAEAEARWCGELDRPFMQGGNTFWRAAILAHLGQVDEAVRLVSQAHEEGQTYLNLARNAFLKPLWGREAYERLMAPKG